MTHRPMVVERDEAELRELARLHVWAGLRSPEERLDAMVQAVEVQMPGTDPRVLARAWLVAAERELARASEAWDVPTDHDRLSAALGECEEHDVLVLRGVDDLAQVRAAVEAAAGPVRGVLWFGEQAVWHAVTAGVLELRLRHGTGAPAAAGDPLATAVVACLGRHGVRAHWREDRVVAEVRWQRRS